MFLIQFGYYWNAVVILDGHIFALPCQSTLVVQHGGIVHRLLRSLSVLSSKVLS